MRWADNECLRASVRKRKVLNAFAGVAMAAGGLAGPAGASSACADLGGEIDSHQFCHVRTVGAGYQVTFTFPVDYPDQQALTSYLAQRRQDFIGYASDDLPRGNPYELDATARSYHSGAATSGTRSLVFTEYSDSGGAHPSHLYAAFNHDLAGGAPITFDTLFKPGTDPVPVLDVIVGRTLQRRLDGGAGHAIPIPPNTVGATMYRNFAITDDAVIFFLDQGQWLSQADGPQEVSVPRSGIAALLA